MSKRPELTSSSSSTQEQEEYFSVNHDNSSIPSHRVRNRPRTTTQQSPKNRKKNEFPAASSFDQNDEETGHFAPTLQLQDFENPPFSSTTQATPISAYLNAFFMTIATVLGTGILGLPVKLSKTGFTPLVATYTLIFFMQVALVVFLIEVLQRARLEFQNNLKKEAGGENDVPLVRVRSADSDREDDSLVDLEKRESDDDDDDDIQEDIEEDSNLVELGASGRSSPKLDDFDASEAIIVEAVKDPSGIVSSSKGEDLYSLSLLYLNPLLHKFFGFAVGLHFISLLITYTLAASEAYGQLFGLHHGGSWIWLAIPFVAIFSCAVIFGSKWLEPIISTFTFAKAGLLVLMVVITAVVGASVKLEISNDWKYIGRPFLIGTVALGGCFNILPVAFDKVRFNSKHIKIFTACAVAGLTLVYLFNLAWCYFVLRIVPQMPKKVGDDSNDTLWGAEQNGQISTVPLVNIINQNHPTFKWIATVVMLFTMVSITVSFIVNSIGWKHFLDGMITASWTPSRESATSPIQRALSYIRNIPVIWKHGIAYAVSFTFILIVALGNPKSFLKIMEKVTSLAANFTGALVCWMLHNCRSYTPNLIPWVLESWIFKSHWFVMGFFIVAMLYSVVSTTAEYFGVTWL